MDDEPGLELFSFEPHRQVTRLLARIRSWRDDAENRGDVMIEFAAQCEQARPVCGIRHDTVAAELPAEDRDLNHQEPYAGVTAGLQTLRQKVQDRNQ